MFVLSILDAKESVLFVLLLDVKELSRSSSSSYPPPAHPPPLVEGRDELLDIDKETELRSAEEKFVLLLERSVKDFVFIEEFVLVEEFVLRLLDVDEFILRPSAEEVFVLSVLDAKESVVFVLLLDAKESSRISSSSSTSRISSSSSTSKRSSSFPALTTMRRTTSSA